jgi:hypothetical protein
MQLAEMLFKNQVRTEKRTPYFPITKIDLLTLFKEIIAVYDENHMEREYADLFIVKAVGHISTAGP